MTWRNEEPLAPVIAPYGLDLSGRILELGPGVGQLRPLVRDAGGIWVGVDKDPRAHAPHKIDYAEAPWALPNGGFDGVFCRNSISASWPRLPDLASEITLRMNRDAWAWISLWTGDSTREQIDAAITEFVFLQGFNFDPRYSRKNQVLVTRGL